MNDKNLKAVLKGVGLPDSILEEIEKPDFDVNAVVLKFNEGQKTHYSGIIENEITPVIEDKVFKQVEGKFLSTMEQDIKKQFAPDKEVMDKIKSVSLPHEKLKILKSFIEEKGSKNSGNEEVANLQREKIEWQNKYTELESNQQTTIANAVKEVEKKVTSRLVDLDLTKKFHAIPAEKIVGGHNDGILLATKSYLASKYDLGLDETGQESVPFEKGTAKRVTLKDGSGKEYFATASELMLSSLKELKLTKESNGGEGSGNGGKGGNSGGTNQTESDSVRQMKERIAKQAA